MNKLCADFLMVASVLCLACTSEAIAAPSVKRLGGGNAYTGTAQAISAKNTKMTTDNGSRISTVRSNRLGSVNRNKSVNSVSSTNNVKTSRLSVGKYLHDTVSVNNRITPTKIETVAKPSEINDLTARVDNLETQMQKKVNTEILEDYKTYVDDNYAKKIDIENIPETNSHLADDWETQKPIW